MPDISTVQLRTLRKALGLTQEDMARLLGFSMHSQVSRLERLARDPDIRMALACEYILGLPVAALFEPIFVQVSNIVAKRARERLNGLSHLSSEAHATRLGHLAKLAEPQPTLFDV